MRVIFLGDVVGEAGRDTLRKAVPVLVESYQADFVVANGENAAGGSGLTPRLAIDLMRSKVDVITLGDHCWDQRELLPFFKEEPRLIRPLNFSPECPGKGWVVVSGNGKKLGVANAMGRTFMRYAVDNPFTTIDEVLREIRKETPCILVDFHAEATSEKIAFGYAMDGRVSAVVGTHTHVQTADERILPGGTAYITDTGFCGPHDSIIGSEKGVILERYRNLMPVRHTVAKTGLRANGVVVEIDESTGRAQDIQRIQYAVEETSK